MAYQKINIGDTVRYIRTNTNYTVVALLNKSKSALLEGGRLRIADWPNWSMLNEDCNESCKEFTYLQTLNAKATWFYLQYLEDSNVFEIIERGENIMKDKVKVSDQFKNVYDEDVYTVVCLFDNGNRALLEGGCSGAESLDFLLEQFSDENLYKCLVQMINCSASADWDYVNSLANPENYTRIEFLEKTNESKEEPLSIKKEEMPKINYTLSGSLIVLLFDECPLYFDDDRDCVRCTAIKPNYLKHEYLLDVIETDGEWALVRIDRQGGEESIGWIKKSDITFNVTAENDADLFDGRFNPSRTFEIEDLSSYEEDHPEEDDELIKVEVGNYIALKDYEDENLLVAYISNLLVVYISDNEECYWGNILVEDDNCGWPLKEGLEAWRTLYSDKTIKFLESCPKDKRYLWVHHKEIMWCDG